MPSIQVRDCPEFLYRKLKENAVRENRSIAQEIVSLLTLSLNLTADDKERRKKILENWTIKTPAVKKDDLIKLIREDRER